MRHKVKTKEKPGEYVPGDQCHHYWVIEVAGGPESRGVCKHCGATRVFLNSIPDLTPVKRGKNPLDLPEMPGVELDKDSKS